MKKNRALICGISGQDGSLLADFLIKKNYQIFGTTRKLEISNLKNLKTLKIEDKVKVFNINYNDIKSIESLIKLTNPNEIYFLSGQSSVGLSFEDPIETFNSLTIGVMNFLEAIRISKKPIKFFHASSGDCFGNVGNNPSNENSTLNPCSPYGVAKSSSHLLTKCYRDTYGIYASNGILYNHESELRPARFVTRKIISAAYRISKGSKDKLELGDLNIMRDWGWAEEFVEAIWRMMQLKDPKDFVIATGEVNSLEDFVSYSFNSFGLNWHEHVISNDKLSRPNDIYWSQGNPAKAKEHLRWEAQFKMKNVIDKMINKYQGN